MVFATKGTVDQTLLLLLVVIGFLMLLGISIVLIVVIAKPSALNAVPLIGDAMCQLLEGLGVGC